MEFARLSRKQTNWLVNNEFKHCGFVTGDEIWDVKKLFNLENLDVEEARAVRNAVVVLMANLTTAYREMNDWEEFDRLQDTMSGVVAVIDMRIERFD